MKALRIVRGAAALMTAAILFLPLGTSTVYADESAVPISAEWLPTGDVQPVKPILFSEVLLGTEPVLAATEESNSGIRTVSAPISPGSTNYGYDWLGTQPNSAVLQGLYEALAALAEMASETQESYFQFSTAGWYRYGYADISALNLPINMDSGSINLSGEDSRASIDLLDLVWMVFTQDNPQYYMFGNWGYSYSPGDAKLSAFVPLIPAEYIEYETRQAISARVEAKYQEYEALAATVTEDYDKIRLVHDKMLAERDYSYKFISAGDIYFDILNESDGYYADPAPAAHNILGIMDDTTDGPVCEAFAEAFSYILHRLGVGDAITVVGMAGAGGDGTGGHAWNLVKLGGSYYYVDSTWNNRDNTFPGSAGFDDGNKLNDLYYKYFLVGSDNADFGAGDSAAATHWAGGRTTSAGNEFLIYDLPSGISAADYSTPSAYQYLTDNGLYGRSTATTADDYGYLFGKSNFLGNQSNNNQLALITYVNGYYLNTGPFFADAANVSIYKWLYNKDGELYAYEDGELSAETTLFYNAVALSPQIDFTATIEPGAVGDTVRVWIIGTGANYRGIDFVLATVTGSQNASAPPPPPLPFWPPAGFFR